MNPKDQFPIQLNKARGHSVTLLGAISNRWDSVRYIKAKKTNTVNVLLWLESIEGFIDPEGAVMVIDNHRSHHSKAVAAKVSELKIQMLFLPPTASELNSIELIWGFFK